MPEEDLTYNISLNEEELGAQLDRIRSQIDLTMGSLASGSGAGIPQASDLIDFGAFGAPGGGGGGVTNVSAQMEQGMWSNMAAGFDEAAQTTQLGFNKFSNDMRRIGLMSSPQYPDYSAQNIGAIPQQAPAGFGQSVVGSMAPGLAGFNPNRGGMNYYDYKSQAADQVVDALGGFGANNAGALLGTAIGAFGGWSGAIGGFGVGSTFDIGFELFGSRAKERIGMAEGLKSIADDAFGGMGSSEARNMAGAIQDMAYSWEGKTKGYDMDNLQENVIGFANAGGFKATTGPEDMERVLKGVVENTREFANNMKMAQDDAVKIMAELERNMISTTNEMGSFSAGIGTAADRLGMSPTDVVGFGLQGTEMLRGTGATNQQGFNMALEARLQTERLRFADPTTRQLISKAGGADQFAVGQMETAARWMQSGQGMMAMTGLLGGMQGLPGSITGMLQGSANYLSDDPLNFFRFQSRQGELNASLGFNNQQAMMVGTAHKLASQLGMTDEGGGIDEDALVGIMMNGMNLSAQDARGAIAGVRDLARNPAALREADRSISTILSASEEAQSGIWDTITGTVSYGAAKVFTDNHLADAVGAGFTGAFDAIEDTGEDLADWWVGRNRIRNGGISTRGAQSARSFIGTEEYNEIINRESGGRVTDAEIQERLEDYGTYASGTPYNYITEDGRFSKKYLDRTLAGLADNDQRDELIMSLFNNEDVTEEQMKFYSKFGAGTAEFGGKELDMLDNIEGMSKGDSFYKMADKWAADMTGNPDATVEDLSLPQRAALLSRAKSAGVNINQDALSAGNMAASADSNLESMDKIGDNFDAAIKQSRNTLEEEVRSSGLLYEEGNMKILNKTEGHMTTENYTKLLTDLARGKDIDSLDPADYGSTAGAETIKQLAIQAKTEADKGNLDLEAIKTEAENIEKYKASKQIAKKTSDVIQGLNSDNADTAEALRNNPIIATALTKKIAEKAQAGEDFTYSELEDSVKKEIPEMIQEIQSKKNAEYAGQVSDLVSNIHKGGMEAAMSEGNMKLFSENASKYVESKVMEGLGHIITSEGIKILNAGQWDPDIRGVLQQSEE